MRVSVETPVFKGGWLEHCIDSVLTQSSPHWHLSLLWDGGDEQSRRILEELERRRHPQVTVRFSENRGIARARREITAHSEGELILPLDDDDVLPFNAVERFLEIAASKPWASVIRAQRKFIDEEGKVVHAPPWFPFEPRHYQNGMVTDLFNHSQPYLIRRSAYDRTDGWEGFEDFRHAGEDCDIYLKLEEVGSIELVDETLYYYRINSDRASLVLTDQAAFEMWRRLADKTIARLGLPLRRTNEEQPFQYERLPRPEAALENVDVVLTGDAKPERSLAGRRAVAALRAAGIAPDALRATTGDVRGMNAAFRETTRPLLCLLHPDVVIEGPGPLQALLAAMAQRDADLATPRIETDDGFIAFADPGFDSELRPRAAGALGGGNEASSAAWLSERLVLLRREVVRAVDGFDEGYEDPRMAMVDLSLKARERGFDCAYLGNVSFSQCGPDPEPGAEGDLVRLREKWASRPWLFDGSARPG